MKYIFIICLLALVGCNRSQKKTDIIIPPPFKYYLDDKNALRDMVFTFDAKRDSFVFDKSFKPAALSTIELQKIEALITTRVMKYNTGNRYPIKTPGKYYKQFVPVINVNGEKEVWVNCFCKVPGDDWKQRIINVNDGGSCYFNLKINFTTNTV